MMYYTRATIRILSPSIQFIDTVPSIRSYGGALIRPSCQVASLAPRFVYYPCESD
ncbi:hypothetical protein SCLCIDRAFT_321843 [Scleroderma citrinum Foug A]|uniref:Uncharacterized protein n=1 Tax=Scleroderma citrinum Foug A TaxID=1036808 RepID=A0A0C3E0V7_9AGAM|nr:hypothetical protein SCLCIDRAFT_321843 [Scleroderma citrinum Foug A]